MMDDDALNERIDQLLFAEHAEIKRRNAAPYDGVMGQLPDWIPDNFCREFDATRNSLLATYQHTDLLAYIDEMRHMGMEGNRNPGEFAELIKLNGALQERDLGITPGGMFSGVFLPRTPLPILRDVSVLVQFAEAVNLGPERGLALLTDPEHAKYATKGKIFDKGGRKPGTYSPWKKWIEKSLKKNPRLLPANLWKMFKESPPRGWKAVEPRYSNVGKYIQSPTGHSEDDVTYKRFQDAVGEVKRDLKKG